MMSGSMPDEPFTPGTLAKGWRCTTLHIRDGSDQGNSRPFARVG